MLRRIALAFVLVIMVPLVACKGTENVTGNPGGGGESRTLASMAPLITKSLTAIGAEGIQQIRVLNKCDLADLPPGVERDACGTISTVRTSALTGAGCADLRAALAERFPREKTIHTAPNQDQAQPLPR